MMFIVVKLRSQHAKRSIGGSAGRFRSKARPPFLRPAAISNVALRGSPLVRSPAEQENA